MKRKWAYPELMKKGTVVGPVTPEMRERCMQKIRNANVKDKRPPDENMENWPDMLPIVRQEMKKES